MLPDAGADFGYVTGADGQVGGKGGGVAPESGGEVVANGVVVDIVRLGVGFGCGSEGLDGESDDEEEAQEAEAFQSVRSFLTGAGRVVGMVVAEGER